MILTLALLVASTPAPSEPEIGRGLIHAEVVDATGKPLSGIELDAKGIFPIPRHEITDLEGKADFEDLHPGPWVLTFSNHCQSRISNETTVDSALGGVQTALLILWADPAPECETDDRISSVDDVFDASSDFEPDVWSPDDDEAEEEPTTVDPPED